MKTAFAVALVVTIIMAGIIIPIGYGLVRDVDALIDRAQVAADREDMIGYLKELKQNMERHGMTHGHFVLIFTTPANDLALHFKTVNRALERLDSIKDIPKSETAYQVALSDIRGTVRELHNPALGYLWAKYWIFYVIGFGIWLWPVIMIYSSY